MSVTKKQALQYQTAEEVLVHKNGYEYSIFTIDNKEYKLFHVLYNKRLEEETYFEYKVRKHHVKQFTKKRGTMIWYSKNPSTVSDYNMANHLLQMLAEGGNTDNQELLKKGLDNVKATEEVAYKSNLGTYDKKKVEEFTKSQKNNEDGNKKK